jgi:TRAP-type C4-dicarboxylate transport system substrate-binding protein
MMASKDMYDRFMAEIQKSIEEADKKVKQRAESTLQNAYESYKKALFEKIERELKAAESRRSMGNEAAARQHEVMAGIYRSILEIDLGNPKMIITAVAVLSFALHTGLLPVKVPYLAAMVQMRANSS